MLACFVRQKNGSTCPYVTDELDGHPYENVQLTTHLMEHINNLIKEAKPHIEDCLDHPTAPKWVTGDYRVINCGHRDSKGVPDCGKELKVVAY